VNSIDLRKHKNRVIFEFTGQDAKNKGGKK